jgi:predicted DNA-binding transcriptional regulator
MRAFSSSSCFVVLERLQEWQWQQSLSLRSLKENILNRYRDGLLKGEAVAELCELKRSLS